MSTLQLHDDLVLRLGLTNRKISVLLVRILKGIDDLDDLASWGLVTMGEYLTLKKHVATVTCGAELKVERYGGGTRYACPFCDRGHNGYLSTIRWTNGQPSKSGRCDKLVVNRG